MNPRITVVIPVYNRKFELTRALEALSFQTMPNFEVVVCDDGSTDDLSDVVARFKTKLSLRYIRIENSGGPARPRNVAIGLARGEWISFLDSDDWWDAERLECVSAALDDDVDFIYHRLRVVSDPGLLHRGEQRDVIGDPIKGSALQHMALWGNPVPNSAAIVRRNLLQQIGGVCEDPSIVMEDFDTWLRLVESGARVRFLDEVLGFYWVGKDGISAFSRRQVDGCITLFARHAALFGPDLREVAEACHHYRVGSLFLKLGQSREEAYAHLLRAQPLPSYVLKIKRHIKLIMVFLWRTYCAK